MHMLFLFVYFFHYLVISDLFIFTYTWFINHIEASIKLQVFNHTKDSQGLQ